MFDLVSIVHAAHFNWSTSAWVIDTHVYKG